MSLKRIADNELGITYTLEAIIGVLLIIGTIIYLTGNMPYTAQKTGEFSKVQLMNIGRDNLDLTVSTPESDLKGGGSPIVEYILKANGHPDTYFTNPNSIVNFTVEYRNGQLVNKSMNFKGTILYVSHTNNITSNITYDSITGNESWRVPDGVYPDDPNGYYEYNIQAYDEKGTYSNWVVIKVGYYELSSDNLSIIGNGIVSGIVTDANGIGISNLTIQILTYQGSNPIPANSPKGNTSVNKTINGSFSFDWQISCSTCPKGLYFIQAFNASSSKASNMHVLEYVSPQYLANKQLLCGSQNSFSSCESITVYEGTYVELYMSGIDKPFISSIFYINYIEDNSTGTKGCQSSSCFITTMQSNCQGESCYNATFNASTPGVYSVFTCGPGCGNPWTSASGSNSFVIYVIPATNKKIGNTCVDGDELNMYMRRYIPANVNYNLYLIDSKGNTFLKCPNFPVINGYPTAEAVTVSTIAHIEYIPEKVNNMIEYRMELWYK